MGILKEIEMAINDEMQQVIDENATLRLEVTVLKRYVDELEDTYIHYLISRVKQRLCLLSPLLEIIVDLSEKELIRLTSFFRDKDRAIKLVFEKEIELNDTK